MIDLGTLGGDYGSASYINDTGDIAGWAALAGDQSLDGFLWHDGRMVDLPPVGGAAWAFADSVNDHDQVVGNETNAGGSEELTAVLWAGGHGYDLNTLVAPSRLHIVSADYINDEGDIVGHGFLPDGIGRIFLLIRNRSVPLPRASTPSRPLPMTGLSQMRATNLLALSRADRGGFPAGLRQLVLRVRRP